MSLRRLCNSAAMLYLNLAPVSITLCKYCIFEFGRVFIFIYKRTDMTSVIPTGKLRMYTLTVFPSFFPRTADVDTVLSDTLLMVLYFVSSERSIGGYTFIEQWQPAGRSNAFFNPGSGISRWYSNDKSIPLQILFNHSSFKQPFPPLRYIHCFVEAIGYSRFCKVMRLRRSSITSYLGDIDKSRCPP